VALAWAKGQASQTPRWPSWWKPDCCGRTVIATTVHELQVINGELPEEEHDFHVDLILTPARVIRCESAKRPTGLDWKNMTPEKLAAIPVLRERLRSHRD